MQEQLRESSHGNQRIDPYRTLGRSVRKEVRSYSEEGVFSDSENYINDIIDGFVTRYIISKTDHSIKSRKTYLEEQLHGETVIYSPNGKMVQREVFGLGKLVFKYLLDEDSEVVGMEVVDKDSVNNLPTSELEILNAWMAEKPEWFTK